MKMLNIPTPAAIVPTTLPKFPSSTTNKTLVNLLVLNPLKVERSSDNASTSATVGFMAFACASPANQPAAKSGLSDVIGRCHKRSQDSINMAARKSYA